MLFEGVEAVGPLAAIGLEPLVELHERFGPQTIETALGVPAHVDEPGIAQHLEVAGDPRLVHADLVDQLPHRPLPVPEDIEDPPPRRLRDHIENSKRRGHELQHTRLRIYVQADVAAVTSRLASDIERCLRW